MQSRVNLGRALHVKWEEASRGLQATNWLAIELLWVVGVGEWVKSLTSGVREAVDCRYHSLVS